MPIVSRILVLLLLISPSVVVAQEDDEGSLFDQPEFSDELEAATTPKEEAKAHFHMGVNFYKQGDFQAALVEFKRAQEASPHYKVLFNLGQTALELQDYAGALKYLHDYLEQGGAEITADRKAEVDAMLSKLKKLVAQLKISVNVDGADIFVDNAKVGTSPLMGPVMVSAGRVKVTALKAGMQLDERNVDVAAGELGDVTLSLSPAQAEGEPIAVTATDDAYRKTDDESDTGGGYTGALVMGIVTGAFAAGAGVMTVITIQARDRYNEKLVAEKPTTNKELNSLRNNAKRKAWVTDGLLAAATVSALITTILLITGGDDDPSSASLHVDLGLGSASLSGSF